jgi:AcrR family transcriptional regulator
MATSVELLWGTGDRPTRGPKPGLSLDGIVRAAIDLADSEGLAAVSMQRVAAGFGFTTMSLYRYVPGKNELIDLMVDTAIGPAPALSEIPGGWRPQLREWARLTWAAFARHPWFLAAATGRVMGPLQLGWLEAAIGALVPSGLRGQELMDAVLTVNGHLRALAPFHASGPDQIDGEGWSAAILGLITGHRDRFPALVAAIGDGAFGPPAGEGYEYGLELILDGIQSRVGGAG